MPPTTSLQFYRKRQTLAHLALERPQCLQSFREAVNDSLEGVIAQINVLESAFCGPEKDWDTEIKRWLPDVNSALRYANIKSFRSRKQLDGILEQFERSKVDPTFKFNMDRSVITKVLDCMAKTLNYSKTGFSQITENILTLVTYMKKYCLSFSPPEGDPFLETATNYERQRRELAQIIKTKLEEIPSMATKFEQDGLTIQDLGYAVSEIAERCDCNHVPFLLIFPFACDNVRSAIQSLRKWLQTDAEYPRFLQFDIADLEKKRDIQAKKVRDMQVKCSNICTKGKRTKRDLENCEEEVKKLEVKEGVYKRDETQLIDENHDVLVDLDIKEFRRDAMKRKVQRLSAHGRESYELLVNEITALKEKKPMIDRKLDDLRRRFEFIEDKRHRLKNTGRKVVELKVGIKEIRRETRKAEVELDRMEASISRLKEILRLKFSAEVLKKIFHNLPIMTKHSTSGRRRMDKLEKAIRVTASLCDGDWARLYQCLPFHPHRGKLTVKTDIDELWDTYMRANNEELTRQCLWRWRRMHTRATVDNLKQALLDIRRKDIVDKIDSVMAKQQAPLPKPQAFRTVRFPTIPVQSVRILSGITV